MKSIVLFAVDGETIDNALEEILHVDGSNRDDLTDDEMKDFLGYLQGNSWSELDDVWERIGDSIRSQYANWTKQP